MTDDATDDELSTRAADLAYERDEGERPSEAVVRAVASVTDTPVLDLDPLYDVVDPRHLDELFGGAEADDGTAPAETSLRLRFAGCRVTVTGDAVHVREAGGDGG